MHPWIADDLRGIEPTDYHITFPLTRANGAETYVTAQNYRYTGYTALSIYTIRDWTIEPSIFEYNYQALLGYMIDSDERCECHIITTAETSPWFQPSPGWALVHAELADVIDDLKAANIIDEVHDPTKTLHGTEVIPVHTTLDPLPSRPDCCSMLKTPIPKSCITSLDAEPKDYRICYRVDVDHQWSDNLGISINAKAKPIAPCVITKEKGGYDYWVHNIGTKGRYLTKREPARNVTLYDSPVIATRALTDYLITIAKDNAEVLRDSVRELTKRYDAVIDTLTETASTLQQLPGINPMDVTSALEHPLKSIANDIAKYL